MKKLFLIVFITLPDFPVFAQMVNMHANTGEVMKAKKYIGVEGSPYLFPEWRTGTFTDVDGKSRGKYQLRYNIYDDELEIIKEKKAISLNHRLVKEFEVFNPENAGRSLFRSGYPAHEEYDPSDFYGVLNDDGDFHLLKKYSCTITKVETRGYGENTATQKFLQSSKYYVYSEKTGFIKINKSRKSIFEVFPKHEQQLKTFIKKNKINIKNDNDLARLIQFCNAIN